MIVRGKRHTVRSSFLAQAQKNAVTQAHRSCALSDGVVLKAAVAVLSSSCETH
jgi:hypothetical protein